MAELISPDLWHMTWPLMQQPEQREIVPNAELHLLDGGHWLRETNLNEVVSLVREFLGRVHSSVGDSF